MEKGKLLIFFALFLSHELRLLRYFVSGCYLKIVTLLHPNRHLNLVQLTERVFPFLFHVAIKQDNLHHS
jgi:hypothetical protein